MKQTIGIFVAIIVVMRWMGTKITTETIVGEQY